jgi:hypothetical protein
MSRLTRSAGTARSFRRVHKNWATENNSPLHLMLRNRWDLRQIVTEEETS